MYLQFLRKLKMLIYFTNKGILIYTWVYMEKLKYYSFWMDKFNFILNIILNALFSSLNRYCILVHSFSPNWYDIQKMRIYYVVMGMKSGMKISFSSFRMLRAFLEGNSIAYFICHFFYMIIKFKFSSKINHKYLISLLWWI